MTDHDVVSEPVWHGNGAVGMEVRCRTCDWVLWQSGPDTPYDASGQLVIVKIAHQAQMRVQDREKAGGEVKEAVKPDVAEVVTSAAPAEAYEFSEPKAEPYLLAPAEDVEKNRH